MRGRALLAVLATVVVSFGVLVVAPSGPGGAATGDGGLYTAVTPARLLDTRNGTGATAAPVAAGAVVALQVTGSNGVPAAGVSAVALNVTITAAQASGYVTVWADGSPRPPTSNLNFVAGATVANLTIVPVGADGKVDILNAEAGTAQLIADISGYYAAGTESAPGSLTPLSPDRILDTRSGNGAPLAQLAPAAVLPLQVDGRGGVPTTGVSAVVLNLTVDNAHSAGYITAWPDGTARPVASNLNFVTGQVVANLVIVPIGADGKVDLVSGVGAGVDLIADVFGYFTAGRPSAPGALTGLTPSRLVDTRSGLGAATGPVAPDGTLVLAAAGHGGVPASGVAAVVLNVTVTGLTAGGFITVSAHGSARPTVSSLNFISAGQTVANAVIAPVGADGEVDLYNGSTGSSQLVIDISGYILSGPSLTWTESPTLDTGESGVANLSCPSANFCAALDDSGHVDYFDGHSWSTPTLVGLGILPNDIACASSSFCLAGGVQGELARFDGTSWTHLASVPVTAQSFMTNLTCVSSAFCLTIDTAGKEYTTQNQGQTWSAGTYIGPSTAAPRDAISCPSAQFCVATSRAGDVMTYSSGTWGQPVPTGASQLFAISCTSVTFCVATGDDGQAVYMYDGTSWSRSANLDPTPIFRISCADTSRCVALDDSGRALTFNGSSWSQPAAIGITPATGVSCPTVTFCLAAGSTGTWATLTGTQWSSPQHASIGTVLWTVSCPTTTFCVASDDFGQVITDNDGTWSNPVGVAAMIGVSCTSPTWCVGVDGGTDAYTFNGSAWSSALDLGANDLTSVSCASTTFCVAVDHSGFAYRYDGSTWTRSPASIVASGQGSVSCPTATFCVAVNGAGAAAVYQFGSWQPAVSLPAAAQSVSCTLATNCVAVGAGAALTYDGTGWSAPVSIDNPAYRLSVSCVSSTFCVATDVDSAVIMNGTTWSSPQLIADPRGGDPAGLESISCASTTFCVTVDFRGEAIIGR